MLADVAAQARPEQGKSQAADDLVDAQRGGHEGVDGCKRPPGEHGRHDPGGGALGFYGDEKSADGPREHHPLDAEVEHPRSLAEDLPQGGVKKRRSGAHGRGQKGDEGIQSPSQRTSLNRPRRLTR